MPASLLPVPKAKFFDRSGNPLAGGKLYTYVAGSVNTPKATYKDYNKVATNTNPVILDAYGEADIWLDGNYKLNLTDSAGVAQWSSAIDNVSSITSTNSSYTTTGVANTYILTPSPAITSYAGSSFTIIANFTNTGPATLNVNGLGAVALTKNGTTALVAGDMVSGQVYYVSYDGTNFQILNGNLFNSLTTNGLATFGNNLKLSTSGNGIVDNNGNNQLLFTTTASAVNYFNIGNAATGGSPYISATGTDTNVDFSMQTKGTGAYKALGTATASAELRLYEQTTNGTNYIGLKAPASVGADKTFILPNTDGTNYQSLITNGSGTLNFSGGLIIQKQKSMISTQDSTATAIPHDDTIPQITEGKEYTTLTFTPLSALSTLRITISGFVAASIVANVGIGLWVDTTANCLAFAGCNSNNADRANFVQAIYEVSSASTSARTYRLRFGGDTGTTYINGTSGGRFYGGVQLSGISIDEIV